jgi:hypothetical protein
MAITLTGATEAKPGDTGTYQYGEFIIDVAGPDDERDRPFRDVAAQTSFLPAPTTWIEWLERNGSSSVRTGVLLTSIDIDDKDILVAVQILDAKNQQTNHKSELMFGATIAFSPGEIGKPYKYDYHLLGFDGKDMPPEALKKMGKEGELTQVLAGLLYTQVLGFLALINTPKIVGRITHLPHAGLQRKLTHAYSMPGKYPLQAWHEIKLHVTVPYEQNNEKVDGYLTGTRALHFCRSYLRIRQGRLELVNWHWRGNPAIGLKQTRYKVMQ